MSVVQKILPLLLVFAISNFISCSSSTDFDHNAYYDNLDEQFELATVKFFEGDYLSAKQKFQQIIIIDSNYHNYESYAFLANCYVNTGNSDSGKVVYQNGIEEINNLSIEKKKRLLNIDLITQELNEWSSVYPKLPAELQKENGFSLEDKLPFPVGGIKEIQKHLVYPLNSKGRVSSGTVLLATLIDENGKAIEFKVEKTIGESYEIAAMNAIKSVNFTQPKRKGRPNKIWVKIPVSFKQV